MDKSLPMIPQSQKDLFYLKICTWTDGYKPPTIDNKLTYPPIPMKSTPFRIQKF